VAVMVTKLSCGRNLYIERYHHLKTVWYILSNQTRMFEFKTNNRRYENIGTSTKDMFYEYSCMYKSHV